MTVLPFTFGITQGVWEDIDLYYTLNVVEKLMLSGLSVATHTLFVVHSQY